MQHVFIIGSRGLPAQYGGFETFVDQLVSNRVSPNIKYHVACLSNDQAYYHFDYKGVDCFTIKAPKLGPARVIAYDMMAINYALKLIKKQGIEITKGSFSKCLKNLSFISCNIASFVDFMKSNTARPKAKRQIGKAGEANILL